MTRTHRMPFVAPLLLAMLLASAGCSAASYDGNWWRKAPQQERRGFLAGYSDCALYDAGPRQFADVSWNTLEPQITARYEGGKAALRTSVPTMIDQVVPRSSAKGSPAADRHGIFDGDYWRQSSAEHRLGFVSGYLECYKKLSSPKAKFSSSPADYVGRISRWYGTKEDDPAEIDMKRVNQKIADVLYRFRDGAGTASSRSARPAPATGEEARSVRAVPQSCTASQPRWLAGRMMPALATRPALRPEGGPWQRPL